MAKNRHPRVFPKPPQRLNSQTAKALGKNSNNKCMREANLKGIYFQTSYKGSNINDDQLKVLISLRKTLKLL